MDLIIYFQIFQKNAILSIEQNTFHQNDEKRSTFAKKNKIL